MTVTCVQHTVCGTKIIARFPSNLFIVCSTCGSKYSDKSIEWVTWTLNFPLQKQPKSAIVLKPSTGNFSNYIIGDDLHIGIVNSQSIVYSYWTSGVEIENSAASWENSLVIFELSTHFQNVESLIDETILTFSRCENFKLTDYNEKEWNCFDFVLAFLKFIKVLPANHSKNLFVEEVVQKKLYKVVKYCQLMADFLEDFSSDDSNRKIDNIDFLTNQFNIFTNEYREKTEPSCCAIEDGDHSNCEQVEKKSKQSKKEIVNITRKLQRALISLEMMNSGGAVSELLKEIRRVNSDLRDMILKTESEFSISSVPLPNYDAVDMKCLLGDGEVKDLKPARQLLKEEVEKVKNTTQRLLLEADILIREYEHIKKGTAVI